jgi:hypothetical protein
MSNEVCFHLKFILLLFQKIQKLTLKPYAIFTDKQIKKQIYKE